jgi:cytochrome c-type biogenesis protein CcmH/NrfG
VRSLAEEPGELSPTLEENKTHQDSRTLAEKLRELAELKEAGLITPKEFEAKRRDLLDRL